MNLDHQDDRAPADANLWRDARFDRSALVVESLTTATNDTAYWLSRSPTERIAHVEFLRRLNYGDAAGGRLQRILEVVHKPCG